MPENSPEFCREVAISNDYEDFLIEFSSDLDYLIQELNPVCLTQTGARFGVFYQPRDPNNERKYLNMYDYNLIPNLFGLLDTTNVEASGVLKVRRQPYLDLFGNDVIIGFIDTGIDYQNPLFLNADRTTRIVSIWDQTDQTGTPPEGKYYGTEYTREQINEALQSDDPLSIVPSTDENGHGTFMAGLAAGGIDSENDFTGIAPNASIVMVKLKESKPYLKELFGVPQNVIAYSGSDILLAVNYLWSVSRREQKPIVVCIGVGSNSGDHTGRSTLSSYLNEYADLGGNCIVVAAGNEGNQAHHFSGQLTDENEVMPIEIRVGSDEPGFTLELWGQLPYLFSVSITSPTGEVIPRVLAKVQQNATYKLTFETTQIDVKYNVREARTGDEFVFLRFKNPTQGIWTVNVYADTRGRQTINAWLPMQQFVSKDTYFIRPDPDITITQPGNTGNVITVTAYDHTTDSIYIESGRGLTRDGLQKPDLAAPGVNVYGPVGRNQFDVRSGTSVAVAQAAGICALVFDWGIIQRNNPYISTLGVKYFLVSGAERSPNMNYPNNIWGYGTIDLYEALNNIRITSS